MAEQFSEDQEREVTTPATPIETAPGTAARATSRLSILIAFIAGAFAAWIIITMNVFG
jgi:hypothetical protein